MKLKEWFCACFQPVEVREFSSLQHTQFQRGGIDAPNPFRNAQNRTSFEYLASTERMVLCQALIDSSPEPVSVYEFATGRLLLSNAAFKNLPGGCVNLPGLFALDPASLHDALSRVHSGLCWRGLIQLPAGLQSHASLQSPWVPVVSSTRPSTGNGIVPPCPSMQRVPEMTDPAPIHNLGHASSSTRLRQALQVVAYPSLRLHGSPASTAAAAATLAYDDPGAALQQPVLLPTDSFTQWRAGGGNGKMVGLTVTAITADAATAAADTIVKATRAAALAKAAAQAAAAEAAAEAERTRPISAPTRDSPTAPPLPMLPQPAPPQVCLSSPDTTQPGATASAVANLKSTLSSGNSAATAAGGDDLTWDLALGSADPPSWSGARAVADILPDDRLPMALIRPGSTSALMGAGLAAELLGVFHQQEQQQQQKQQGNEAPTALHNGPQGFDGLELAAATVVLGAETSGAAARAAATDRVRLHHSLGEWHDGMEGRRLTVPLMARRGTEGEGGGGDITNSTATVMSESSKVPKATEAAASPQPLQPGLPARRRNNNVQPAAQPALLPHSQNLLEALTTSTWGTRI
ncbi:hypothetical protein VaNZ11_012189, partial [Volvox africanus]